MFKCVVVCLVLEFHNSLPHLVCLAHPVLDLLRESLFFSTKCVQRNLGLPRGVLRLALALLLHRLQLVQSLVLLLRRQLHHRLSLRKLALLQQPQLLHHAPSLVQHALLQVVLFLYRLFNSLLRPLFNVAFLLLGLLQHLLCLAFQRLPLELCGLQFALYGGGGLGALGAHLIQRALELLAVVLLQLLPQPLMPLVRLLLQSLHRRRGFVPQLLHLYFVPLLLLLQLGGHVPGELLLRHSRGGLELLYLLLRRRRRRVGGGARGVHLRLHLFHRLLFFALQRRQLRFQGFLRLLRCLAVRLKLRRRRLEGGGGLLLELVVLALRRHLEPRHRLLALRHLALQSRHLIGQRLRALALLGHLSLHLRLLLLQVRLQLVLLALDAVDGGLHLGGRRLEVVAVLLGVLQLLLQNLLLLQRRRRRCCHDALQRRLGLGPRGLRHCAHVRGDGHRRLRHLGLELVGIVRLGRLAIRQLERVLGRHQARRGRIVVLVIVLVSISLRPSLRLLHHALALGSLLLLLRRRLGNTRSLLFRLVCDSPNLPVRLVAQPLLLKLL
mmetsp:Transcript_17693/g.33838  ORF Transcript_17693/g.33838 Transcript_17693/m.33838 type:complete len:553 (+) Transcript_17693:411-2069(+)